MDGYKEIMSITVTLLPGYEVKGKINRAVLLPFTAEAKGGYFCGETVGYAADTQLSGNDGSFSLSARYILHGADMTGSECSVFIENNGNSLDDCHPLIVTDSRALAFLEDANLRSTVTQTETGVIVKIFCLKQDSGKE